TILRQPCGDPQTLEIVREQERERRELAGILQVEIPEARRPDQPESGRLVRVLLRERVQPVGLAPTVAQGVLLHGDARRAGARLREGRVAEVEDADQVKLAPFDY